MAQSKIEQLESFFKRNMNIKSSIARLAFAETDIYNEDYAMAYSDKIYKELCYMQDEFISMAKEMFGDYVLEQIIKKFDTYFKVLNNCGANGPKLHNFYRYCIADISLELKSEVKQNCVGYYMFRDAWGLLKKETSINGLLHILHSYVMNNENIYDAVEEIDTKDNKNSEPITLRGRKDNILAKLIYENFNFEFDCGKTDILALGNKTLIMVRDLGHALTVELEEYPDGIMVRYFIPKLCDIDKINALRGINKVPKDAPTHSGARGEFLTTKEQVLFDLFDFLSKVPTDADLIRKPR